MELPINVAFITKNILEQIWCSKTNLVRQCIYINFKVAKKSVSRVLLNLINIKQQKQLFQMC